MFFELSGYDNPMLGIFFDSSSKEKKLVWLYQALGGHIGSSCPRAPVCRSSDCRTIFPRSVYTSGKFKTPKKLKCVCVCGGVLHPSLVPYYRPRFVLTLFTSYEKELYLVMLMAYYLTFYHLIKVEELLQNHLRSPTPNKTGKFSKYQNYQIFTLKSL